MRIVICDDEQAALNGLYDMLSDQLLDGDTLECFSNGLLISDAQNEVPIDVIFLDIEMPGLNGLEIGYELRRVYKGTHIVYVTKHRNFALDAFDIRAFHYLVKPVRPNDIRSVLREARVSLSGEGETLQIATKQGTAFEKHNDILYIESFLHKLTIHSVTDKYVCNGRLREYELELTEKGFYRIHKSYLINMSHVKRVENREVWLDNSIRIPIGNTRSITAFHSALGAWRRRA